VAAGALVAAAGAVAAGGGLATVGGIAALDGIARLSGPVGWPAWPAAALAIAFVWCQGRILRAARGIPTWREPRVVPLVVATGLAEGGGLFLAWSAIAGAAPRWAVVAFAAALLARFALWHAWRSRLHAAPGALAVVDAAGRRLRAATLLALVAVGAAAVLPAAGAAASLPSEGTAAAALQAVAGLLALAGGAWFKFTLVTRAAFTQGFSLPHLPVRGVPRG
jgi:phenylacetyl-CoA:acceptor oxidoreductase subunit 2